MKPRKILNLESRKETKITRFLLLNKSIKVCLCLILFELLIWRILSSKKIKSFQNDTILFISYAPQKFTLILTFSQ